MFFPYAFLVLATLGSAAAFDVVLESALTEDGGLTFFGNRLAGIDGSPQALILCALSATAALALVSAVAHVRGRRLERRMAAELDARWEELSRQNAADRARFELLSWRNVELQTSLDELISKRDEAYEEMRKARERTLELREAALQQRKALKELARIAETQLIVVPDLPEELLAAGDGTELSEG